MDARKDARKARREARLFGLSGFVADKFCASDDRLAWRAVFDRSWDILALASDEALWGMTRRDVLRVLEPEMVALLDEMGRKIDLDDIRAWPGLPQAQAA